MILGVKRDEVVAISIRPCPEWLYLAFGAVYAGVKVVGISFTYKDGSDLIASMERLQRCSLLAVDPGVDSNSWEILDTLIDGFTKEGHVKSVKLPSLRYVVGHRLSTLSDTSPSQPLKTIADLLTDRTGHDDISLPILDPDDIVALFQTSGSTGTPKVVARTHASCMHVRRIAGEQGLQYLSSTNAFNDRPFGWAGGTPLACVIGQTRVTMSDRDAIDDDTQHEDQLARMFEVIVEEHCTMVAALPPRLMNMINRQVYILYTKIRSFRSRRDTAS